MAVMLSDLLRNLTFNRSAHCTQVSDQCPLGLLFSPNFKENTAIFPNSKGPGPSPKEGCESPDYLVLELAQHFDDTAHFKVSKGTCT